MVQAYGQLSTPDTLSIERLLPGPIERIWRYLTEPELRQQWLAAGPMELRVGGAVELVFNNNELTSPNDPPPEKYACYGGEHRMQATITGCKPPYLLSYTWAESDGEGSEVQFQLSERGDQVLLQITHSRLYKPDQLLSVAAGWHVHLDILVAHLANQSAPRFWATHTRLEAEYAQRFQLANKA